MIKLLTTGLLLAHCLMLSGCCTSSRAMKHHEEKIAADNEAIGFLLAVNQYEIDAAEAVIHKLHHENAIEFAKLMIHDHEKNLSETKHISHKNKIKPLETSEIIHLKEKVREALATLRSAEKDTEGEYVRLMVEGHRDALSKLDNYLENVRDLDLKRHLEATREHVAHHLEKAKALQ